MSKNNKNLCASETDIERKLFEGVCERFEEVSEYMKLNEKVYCILSQPKMELMLHFPVLMDNGEYKTFKG